jgi:hypothetical protein
MVGLTLSAEDMRSAPPEIRNWLAQQAAGLFGAGAAEASHPVPQSLAACTIAEARAILSQIQDMLPVVSVFFELGRESAGAAGPGAGGPGAAGHGVRVFSLPDIQRHARLRAPEQVAQCLGVINQILGSIRNDPKALLCGLDPQGRCFVAEATSQAILSVWHEVVASHALEPVDAMPEAAASG